MMPLLIEGPKQPGNDIDVFLEPLMEDLETLWHDGVKVLDEYKREHFTLKYLLFVKITDLPRLGALDMLGQATQSAEIKRQPIPIVGVSQPAVMGQL